MLRLTRLDLFTETALIIGYTADGVGEIDVGLVPGGDPGGEGESRLGREVGEGLAVIGEEGDGGLAAFDILVDGEGFDDLPCEAGGGDLDGAGVDVHTEEVVLQDRFGDLLGAELTYVNVGGGTVSVGTKVGKRKFARVKLS